MKRCLNYFLLIIPILLLSKISFGQLENGSVAPDFTLTDINSNQQNLYSYLNAGKTVYIDFFACHCPYCWNYHNSHALSDLFDTHGPATSSNDVFVMAIELDPNNGIIEFHGTGGVTQGNWVEGTNYPQINPEGSELSEITTAYNVTFYPMIYAICPDKTITLIGTKTSDILYEHVAACLTNEIEAVNSTDFHISVNDKVISVSSHYELSNVKIELTDLQGKTLVRTSSSSQIDAKNLISGMYLLSISFNNKLITKKIFIP